MSVPSGTGGVKPFSNPVFGVWGFLTSEVPLYSDMSVPSGTGGVKPFNNPVLRREAVQQPWHVGANTGLLQ